jgi:hypothetical protein
MTNDKPTIVEINCTTGEVIERAYNAEELKQREKDIAEWSLLKAEEEAKAKSAADLKTSAKAKLIAGKPLTEEEASILVI